VKLLLAWIAWLFSDPQAFDAEYPRAAAAVIVAAASLEAGGVAPPQPPKPEGCCKDCGGTGKIRQPDGHLTDCPCDADCKCKANRSKANAVR
jgi:hypothetical protein